MKKIFCGAVIALIGVIYSIALMALATVNAVCMNGNYGLLGLLQGYDAVFPLIVSLFSLLSQGLLYVFGELLKRRNSITQNFNKR